MELAKLKPQIVNAGTPKAGLLGMVAATACRVKARVYTVHGLRLETTSGARRVLLGTTERVAAGLAHRVFCVSPSLHRAYVAGGYTSPGKVFFIGAGSANGIDVERFDEPEVVEQAAEIREQHGISAGAPVIGFVGRLTRDKGIAELHRALAKLAERFPGCRLLLVGGFESGDPLPGRVVDALRADPAVVITGFVDDELVPAYYRLMKVLALPSFREGFPTCVLEAGASSIPVVGYGVTGVVDAIRDGVNGTLVEAGDVIALTEAIGKYLADPGLARTHGRAGRERVEALFDQNVIWSGLLGLYDELLGMGGRS